MIQVDKYKFYSVLGPLDVCLFSHIKVNNGKVVVITTFKLRYSDKEIGRSVDSAYFLDSEVVK